MASSVMQMMEAANAAVPRITPIQAREMIAKGNTLVVDVRDALEVEKSGKVAGALHVSRGMLEFRADPESPSTMIRISQDNIFYCDLAKLSVISNIYLVDKYKRFYLSSGQFYSDVGSPRSRFVRALEGRWY
jgi:hypothetical protein